jgi:hypothetical protein
MPGQDGPRAKRGIPDGKIGKVDIVRTTGKLRRFFATGK